MDEIVKAVSDLSPIDFREHPIWSWYENIEDESLVTPVEEGYLLSEDYDEYDPLFILSEFTLCDGTKLEGEIAIMLDVRKVYMISFFKKNDIFTFSLHPTLKKFDTPEKITNWLQKPIEDIFPIEYTTLYHFNDGEAIAGEISLEHT
jgi:hypothetical protein